MVKKLIRLVKFNNYFKIVVFDETSRYVIVVRKFGKGRTKFWIQDSRTSCSLRTTESVTILI